MTPARALYVYAVVPEATAIAEVCGIGDEPVEVVVEAGLGIVVSDVDVRLLEEVNGAEDAAGAARLGALAKRHHDVVREIGATATSVLPFRLGTLVADRDAARRYLVDSADVLTPALGRVLGCGEWGVTVHEGPIERTTRDEASRAQPAASGKTEASGTAYLLRRREAIAQEQELRRARARAGAEVHAELVTHAVDSSANRSRRADALLCKNYLVHREAEPAFFEAADRCGDRLLASGLRLEVSGPWPPYSFAPGRLRDLGEPDV